MLILARKGRWAVLKSCIKHRKTSKGRGAVFFNAESSIVGLTRPDGQFLVMKKKQRQRGSSYHLKTSIFSAFLQIFTCFVRVDVEAVLLRQIVVTY